MCYRGCQYENYEGDCARPRYALCPMNFDTDEEHEEAEEEEYYRYLESMDPDDRM